MSPPVCFRLLLFTAALTALLVTGCSDESAATVDQTSVLQGAEQCTMPGKDFKKVLRVELSGPKESGLLGGKGGRLPAVGVKVRFEVDHDSDLVINPAEAVTDGGGMAETRIKAGKKTGDQYIKVIPEGYPDKAISVRFVSGMETLGDNRELKAGSTAPQPVGVKLMRGDGKPAVGVPVYFSVRATAEGARTATVVATPTAITNADGIASTEIKLGKKTGIYNIGVEVSDPDSGFVVRDKSIRLLGFNPTAVIIAVLGGLALFILGMKMMGEGIQKVAGENMRRILQFFAGNRFVAVLAGMLVTAVIQASGATTVMVIGFINAGLLNLVQAIGIIFGANIGTTVTAQIISFNLSGLALPAVTLGFLMTLSKRRTVSGWGEAVLGFGLLFFGMMLMCDELKTLGDLPSFVRFFQVFDCKPLTPGGMMPFGAIWGAIAIGMLATIMIQSSSAAMGVVLALAAGGLVNFYTSVPLMIGTNIGTTLTALVAAFAANRVAKQAALAHMLFNLFGAALMIALFYIPYGAENTPVFLYFVNSITPGNAFAPVPQNIERHIAMAHTFFNVAVVLVLLPFIRQFAWVCNRLLPITAKSDVKITLLEPGLLKTPSVALKQSLRAVRLMVSDSWKMIDEAVNTHFLKLDLDKDQLAALEEAEQGIDRMQADVTAYLVNLTRQQLTENQSDLVPLLMHCTNDAERIADHCANIIQLAERLAKSDKKLSDSGKRDIKKMWKAVNDEAKYVIAALDTDSKSVIKSAMKEELKLNQLANEFEEQHIARLRKGNCTMTNGIIFIEMLGELEKVGDHLCNIVERTHKIQKHCAEL
ncbi:MAG: Na/Pi symporter [Victivallaceae bacterium]|nr:Na/Pi symporter [Victivallaceae bacterium]